MSRYLVAVMVALCLLAAPAHAEFAVAFGTGSDQVAFFNNVNHPDVEQFVPMGPLAFRVAGSEAWIADSVGGRILRVAANGKVLAAHQVMKADGCYIEDLALVFDRKGQVTNVWFLDGGSQQIVEMSAAGKVLRRLGGSDDQPGSFSQLHRIEVGKSGRLYVADKIRQTLTVMDPESGKVVRERGWEWSGLCLDPRENLCTLKWDAEARETHLIREDFDGKVIDDTVLALGGHGNPELWWINAEGEAVLTYVPIFGEGKDGPLTLARVRMSDGKVAGKYEINPPPAMNRCVEPAPSAIWLGQGDYSVAPKGSFAIKRLPTR